MQLKNNCFAVLERQVKVTVSSSLPRYSLYVYKQCPVETTNLMRKVFMTVVPSAFLHKI
jgi:hypothetical protein